VRAEFDVELRLDVDERVQAVVGALRHDPWALPVVDDSRPARRAVWRMLASVQRTSPARTRCSDHHSSSWGSALPPRPLEASPHVDDDVELEDFAADAPRSSLAFAVRTLA
jgi:hypothetical protein